jgi:hypothetical protein
MSDAAGNMPPSIEQLTLEPNPFTLSATAQATVVDPDGHPVTCTYVVQTESGTVGVNALSNCGAQLVEDRLPRQVLTVALTARDVHGAQDVQTAELRIGNHAPEVVVLPTVWLFPGESVALGAGATDPDTVAPGGDVLTYFWTEVTAGAPTQGIALDDPSASSPTMYVDRTVYQGPMDRALTFSVRITDDQGLFADAVVAVGIKDERGPYVDNTSAWDGQGPHGYCGAVGRPCNNIADALVNLVSARSDGAAYGAEVLVSTTGQDYALDAELVLDDGISLQCGYDPVQWAQTADRTPLRFSSTFGLRVRSPVRVHRCDVEGVTLAAGGTVAERAAVVAEADGIVLDDNRFVGTSVASSANSAVGVRISPANGTDVIAVRNNEIEGGVGTQYGMGVMATGGAPTVEGCTVTGGKGASAIGVYFDVPVRTDAYRPLIARNQIVGGEAGSTAGVDAAIGIEIVNGNALIEDNMLIQGGSTGYAAVGVYVAVGADGPGISNNAFIEGGQPLSAAQNSIGIGLHSSATLSGNASVGGTGVSCWGVYAAGQANNAGFAISLSTDTVVGCTGRSAYGLQAKNDVQVDWVGGSVRGSAPGAAARDSIGVAVEDGAALVMQASSIESGTASSVARGIRARRDSAVTLRGVTVAAQAAGSSSVGADVQSSSITAEMQGGTITRFSAEAAPVLSMGLALACANGTPFDATLSDVSAVAGSANESYGSRVLSCGTIDSVRGSYTGGTAVATSAGMRLRAEGAEQPFLTSDQDRMVGGTSSSLSMGLYASDAPVDLTDLIATGGDVQTSSALTGRSAGVELADADGFQDDDASVLVRGTLRGGTVSGNTALISAGLLLTYVQTTNGSPDVTGSPVTDLVLDAVDLGGGLSSGTSAGMLATTECINCDIQDTAFTSADAPQSYGFRFQVSSDSQSAATALQFLGNSVAPAASSTGSSTGVSFSRGCDDCRLDRNFITAGDAPAGRSVGLQLQTTNGKMNRDTFVTNNVVRTGAAPNMRALEVSGDWQDSLRVLHNNLHAGSTSALSSFAAAVFMGESMDGSQSINETGLFAGNILDRGTAVATYGFYENCTSSGGASWIARPQRAQNTNFFPQGGTAYVSTFTTDTCTSRKDVTSIGEVNSTAPYESDFVTGSSYDNDPDFLSDGYHISNNSPMRGLAYATYTYWDLGQGWLTDMDGADRDTLIPAPDIGCDEVQ